MYFQILQMNILMKSELKSVVSKFAYLLKLKTKENQLTN